MKPRNLSRVSMRLSIHLYERVKVITGTDPLLPALESWQEKLNPSAECGPEPNQNGNRPTRESAKNEPHVAINENNKNP